VRLLDNLAAQTLDPASLKPPKRKPLRGWGQKAQRKILLVEGWNSAEKGEKEK